MNRTMHGFGPTRLPLFAAVGLIAVSICGCFSEQAHPMQQGDLVRIPSGETLTARPWLRQAHEKLRGRLPGNPEPALLTEDMLDPQGRPINIYPHFHVNPARRESLLQNFYGLQYTAQIAGPNYAPGAPRLDWRGYDEVWIPVNDRLSLYGELGLARRDGQVIDADCIVILPGFLGHNDIRRTKNLADALRANGFHALAIELRGHGKTNERYPDVYYNFGVMGTCDLMVVSEWLQSQPHIRRTGLIGFCWGANQALLAAWYDGRGEKHLSISERLAEHVRPVSPNRHFEAGVIAFSPVLRFEEINEATFEAPSKWEHPVLASLGETARERMILKKHPNPRGYLRALMVAEFARSELNYPGAVDEGLDFIRLLPHRGMPDGNKLADCRVPVLIVQAANDPLAVAQGVADLFGKVANPNVAGIILANGGHIGFPAYARSYYFSLIVNFFDSQTGPGAFVPSAATSSTGCRVK